MGQNSVISYCTISSGAAIKKLHAAGWGLFLTPSALRKNGVAWRWARSQSPPMRYALDNGAWGAFVNETPWDAQEFLDLLQEHGDQCDFAVVPDIVEGGAASLQRSVRWLPMVLERAHRALIPVQDGMSAREIGPLLNERVGVFVGGSTEFKESTLRMWAELARSRSAWCHIGRVNSVRRIKRCTTAQVDSIDGTSAARFSCTLPKLDAARRQMPLLGVLDD